MNNYILDRAFPIESGVESVKNINVQDELEYTNLAEGVHVEGKITIKGDYIKENVRYPFNNTMDVDIFLPVSSLNDCRNIKLYIADFNYQLVDDQLIIKVVYEVQKDESVEQFSLEDQIKGVIKDLQNDPNPFINKMRESITKEDSELLEKALNGDFSDIEIIATSDTKDEDTVHPYIDLSETEEVTKNEEECMEKRDEVTLDDHQMEEEGKDKDIQVVKIQEEAIIESIINSDEKDQYEKKDSSSDLFRNETYAIFATFYKCHEGETYGSIADKFHKDINELVVLNDNKPIEEGTLIQIKK